MPTDQSFADIKAIVKRTEDTVVATVPAHVDAGRFAGYLEMAVSDNRDLLQCTRESLTREWLKACSLGLDCTGTLGECWLVPFKREATLLIGYQGLAKLARQSGKVVRIDAQIVNEYDEFSFTEEDGNFSVKWSRGLSERGKVRGAYALIKLTSGELQAQCMDVDEIETVRNTSRNSNSMMWKSFWGEAAKKTVLRRVAKLAPLAYDLWDRAIRIDNEDYRVNTKSTATTPDHSGSAPAAVGSTEIGDALAGRIIGEDAEDGLEGSDEGLSALIEDGEAR